MSLIAIPFTLAEAGEAKNIDDLLVDVNSGANTMNVSELAAKRINSLVRYFAKHGMI